MLNQIDQDDFWGLAELLGQVKPPVASKADIDRAGLEVIKAEKMKDYEKEGKVTNNTSERVSCDSAMYACFCCVLIKWFD